MKTWAKGKSNAFENALDPRNIHMGSAATELAMATFEKLSTHFGDIAGWGSVFFYFYVLSLTLLSFKVKDHCVGRVQFHGSGPIEADAE